jgi:histidine triad (HIT) family protein
MFILTFIRKVVVLLIVFAVGIFIGRYFFSQVKPRPFLTVTNCEKNCLEPKELLGLLGSIGIQYASDYIPGTVLETKKSIAIKHPKPDTNLHIVVIPKKDIKNIAELNADDEAYVLDALAVAGELARKYNLNKYRVITNGPGYQSVAYLHFHLMSNEISNNDIK